MSRLDPTVPPVGEEIHLPGPSIVPFINAVGLALALVGLAVTLLLTVVGLIVFLWSLVIWIRDARREMNELPLEHH